MVNIRDSIDASVSFPCIPLTIDQLHY